MIGMIIMKVFIGLCILAAAFAKQEAEKTCLEEPDSGMCMAYFEKWYYDSQTESCRKFIYGGCQGNGNRYNSEEECLSNCNGQKLGYSSTDVCDLPAETGFCFARFQRFYFDKASGQCKKFVFRGCGGNENNFKTVEDCEQRCSKQVQSSAVDCSALPDSGLCDAYMPRFYYDQLEGRCKKFIYGGCRGNSNNFRTEEECNKECGDSEDVAQALELPFSCSNENSTYSCCGSLFVPAIRLDQKACVEFTYIGDDTSLRVTIKIGKKIIFSGKISGKNPPPICGGMPGTNLFADVCFDFYDIQISVNKIHICMKIRPRLLRRDITTIEVSCFDYNRNKDEPE